MARWPHKPEIGSSTLQPLPLIYPANRPGIVFNRQIGLVMESTNETRALAYEILAYWERFNNHVQEAWIGDKYDYTIDTQVLPTGAEVNVCSTSLCAAGTAVFLSRPPVVFNLFVRDASFFDWSREGGRLLGLDADEQHLVFLSDEKSAKRYMKAIAAGSQTKFDKATAKRKEFDR